jgi:hypothetical protein
MSGDLERTILGALALRPNLLESFDLHDSDFPIGRLRQTFTAIAGLWEESRPAEIDPLILAEWIGDDGAATFIGSLFDGNIKMDESAFRGRIAELRDKRLSLEIVHVSKALAEEHLKIGTFDEDGFRRLRMLLDRQQEGRGGVNILEHLMPGSALQKLRVEMAHTVEKVLPANSIGLLAAPGGGFKTWFTLGLANAVSLGEPFLGQATIQRPVVYVDFENPLPLLIDRTRKLGIPDVLFWHLSASVPPPKLDTAAYKLYRQLPAGSLVIFDTLRAAHDGDENSSQDMALVMGRLKELRELGFDIFLIHHTPKANERLYKGSSAISDLADHVIQLYRTRRGSLEEIQEDELDSDATFVLTTGKTRFEPFHLYLSFNPDAGGFVLADSPDVNIIDALAEYIAGPGSGNNQSEIIAWAKSEGIGPRMRGSFVALLNRGEREGRWQSHRGFKGARFYEPST